MKDSHHRELDEDHPQIQASNKDVYISFLCRNGPLPERYRRWTDFHCLLIFLVLFIFILIIIMVDGKYSADLSDLNRQLEKKSSVVLFYYYSSMEISALCVLAISFLISLVGVILPHVLGYLMIIISPLLLIGISLTYLISFLRNPLAIKLILTILFFIGSIVESIVIYKKKQKIAHFGQYTEISSKISKSSLFLTFAVLFGYSSLELLLWLGMSRAYYLFNTIDNNQSTFNSTFSFICFVLFWLWLHGFLIAFSDYFSQSMTVKWFYRVRLSKFEESETTKIHLLHIKNVFKQSVQHLGTILHGAILSYMPESIMILIKKFYKQTAQIPLILTYNQYCYVETIMEYCDFNDANCRLLHLRRRIKNNTKQLYMVGHFLGEIIKIFVAAFSIEMLWEFALQNELNSENVSVFKFLLLAIIMGAGLSLQISTNFVNLLATTGDICYFLHSIDLEIERVYYNSFESYSTPAQIEEVFRRYMLSRKWDGKISTKKDEENI